MSRKRAALIRAGIHAARIDHKTRTQIGYGTIAQHKLCQTAYFATEYRLITGYPQPRQDRT